MKGKSKVINKQEMPLQFMYRKVNVKTQGNAFLLASVQEMCILLEENVIFFAMPQQRVTAT